MNTEKSFFKWIRKKTGKLVGGLIAFGVLTGGGLLAEALSLPPGATQVGTINHAPVIKSPTSDISSKPFQNIVSALLEGTNTPSTVVNQVAWGGSTFLANGRDLSSYGQSPISVFGADGFNKNDKAVLLDPNGMAVIKNVGKAIDTSTGQEIPLSLGIVYLGSKAPGGAPLGRVLMAAKSQNSVITLAWGAPARTDPGETGGSTEGGGTNGGTNDGTGFWFLEEINYRISLINSNTGKVLPNDSLMPIKMSDIDASQLATMGGQGAKGYILSKDTALTPQGNGFKSSSDGAIIEDTIQLSPNSYIVVKQYNANSVQYQYTDGKNDHLDIVTGIFGSTPWNLSDLLGGFIEIDKSIVQSNKDLWNNHYQFSGLNFELINKEGKVVDIIKLDDRGYGKSKRIPVGDYTVHETSTNWTSTGQTVMKDVTATVKPGDTTTIKPKNTAVTGKSSLKKVDKKTGTAPQGKGVLKTAKYQLFYNDESKGASPHKVNDPVKWKDVPNPKVLKGEKVTEAVIGGKKVDLSSCVVLDVDDKDLMVGVENLALGKYYWKEIDAGVGYVVDPQKHEFELTMKDQNTAVVVAKEQLSEEQIIKANVIINKMVTIPGTQGGSGYNGIEFTAKPINGTKAEPIKTVTGVDLATGDDGFATFSLVYGDWKIEETKGVEGYEDVRPVYIHMTTDTTTDVLTITVSYNEDFSQPFSKRTFGLQDSATAANPAPGTVGEVTPSQPTISLSTIHFNDNPKEPEKPDLPTKDVIKVETGSSIDEKEVALDSDFIYVLNSSVLKPGRDNKTVWTILDDYDETFDRYNGTFHVHAATNFGSYKVGDQLPKEFFTAKEKKGKVSFTAEKAFLDVVNAHKNQKVGFTIHADFYRFKPSESVVNVFTETINKDTEKSNEVITTTPDVAPHKFDLSKEKVDLTGNRLLDDDKEMKDRYKDSNEDPYVDDLKNNEEENINTTGVKLEQKLVYQLWLDTKAFDATSELTQLQMVDTYDKKSLDIDAKEVRVYDFKGNNVTKYFAVENKRGKLTIKANVFKKAKNSKQEEVNIVDTSKIPFGHYYKIDVPATVKKDVKPGTDIINTAVQEWTDSDGTDDSHITEKRVNKVEQPLSKDVIKVEEGDSINEKEVALASDFVYVLNSSILNPRRDDKTVWTILDDYDEKFDRFNGTFHVHAATDFGDYKAGDELPKEFFTAKEEKGTVLFTAEKPFLELVNAHKDQEVGFTIHADFNRFVGSDKVVNIFTETINEEEQKSNEVVTNTPEVTPHKFDLSKKKVDLTGDRLLDDDKEMKDRYEDSNKDPYADDPENNEKENINTTKVKPGQKLVYQLWLDTKAFDKTSKLIRLQMVDTYDQKSLEILSKEVKVYDAEGKDVTGQFVVEDKEGKLTIKANAFKKAKNSKQEEVKIIDTEKIPLGGYYKIDVPATVKKDVKPGTEIINTAQQEWTDSEGTDTFHVTEKRVNKVEKEKKESSIQKLLPQTGETSSWFILKIIGWSIFAIVVILYTVKKKKDAAESKEE